MKNYLIFVLKAALDDFVHNKGRTFLTSLGILIGVLSVILLIAFGLGLKKYINDQFESLGANLLYIMPGNKKSFFAGFVGGIKFDNKDVSKLKKLKGVSNIAGVFAKPASIIQVDGKTEVVEIVAANEEVSPLFNLESVYGRLLEKTDIEKKDKAILIATTLVEKLFNGPVENALGKKVMLERQNFKIIGIIKSKGGGGIGGASMDSHVYIPFTTAYTFNPDKKFMAVYVKVKSKDQVAETKQEAEKILVKRYNKDDFSVLEQTEIMSTVTSIFGIINTVLVAIAAISLVVGGIGIMNIMYVTVSERIREIGIRRALGARKNDILYHFLIESVILSLIGGVVGLILAFIIVLFIQKLFPAYIDITSVVLALGVSSSIGVIFGVFPAKKAADLTPVEAIRYE